jgi:signal transduction histidine kinase
VTAKRKTRSLFWTFAGSYLVVLLAAGFLQALLLIVVAQSLYTQWNRDRANQHIDQAIEELSELSGDAADMQIMRVLMLNSERGAFVLAFENAEGRRFPFRPFPRGGRPGADRFGPPGDGDPPRPPGGSGAPGPGMPPGGEDAWKTLVNRKVDTDNGISGTIIALHRPPPTFEPLGATFRLTIFIPVALLLAGAAGMIMFRSFVKRTRSLEAFATQVTEGKLDARVEDLGADEIGRLAYRLNRMAEALETSKNQMETNDSQRRQLFADITHELATPLTSIRGYVETLLNPDIPKTDEECDGYLKDVLRQSRRIELLVQELLELSRLESGSVGLEKEKLDWVDLCQNTLVRFEKRFQEAGLSLSWKGPEERALIVADGRWLEHVLENLLTNALKYVPAGGAVWLSMEWIPNGEPSYRLTVSDDGPGFAPEDLPHIFDRFYRGDPARSSEGTGLGLAIVKEIIRLHGGGIEARIRPSGGAQIIVELPVGDISSADTWSGQVDL